MPIAASVYLPLPKEGGTHPRRDSGGSRERGDCIGKPHLVFDVTDAIPMPIR
jgi:hypothetical protein